MTKVLKVLMVKFCEEKSYCAHGCLDLEELNANCKVIEKKSNKVITIMHGKSPSS